MNASHSALPAPATGDAQTRASHSVTGVSILVRILVSSRVNGQAYECGRGDPIKGAGAVGDGCISALLTAGKEDSRTRSRREQSTCRGGVDRLVAKVEEVRNEREAISQGETKRS